MATMKKPAVRGVRGKQPTAADRRSATPIRVPAGATHKEPSWRDELKRIGDAWIAGGGAKGHYQRAITSFLSWRGPTRGVGIKQKGEVVAKLNTAQSNGYLHAGVWIDAECATGQSLCIWLADQSKLADGDRAKWPRSFIVQDEAGMRYVYVPATVVAILKRGYPDGTR